jgi:hypothetical protein
MQYANDARLLRLSPVCRAHIIPIHQYIYWSVHASIWRLLLWPAVDLPAVLALAVSTAAQDVANAIETTKERSLLQWGGMSASQAQAQAQAGESRPLMCSQPVSQVLHADSLVLLCSLSLSQLHPQLFLVHDSSCSLSMPAEGSCCLQLIMLHEGAHCALHALQS